MTCDGGRERDKLAFQGREADRKRDGKPCTPRPSHPIENECRATASEKQHCRRHFGHDDATTGVPVHDTRGDGHAPSPPRVSTTSCGRELEMTATVSRGGAIVESP